MSALILRAVVELGWILVAVGAILVVFVAWVSVCEGLAWLWRAWRRGRAFREGGRG